MDPSETVRRVNGRAVQVEAAAGERLADVLRDRLGLFGTKIACGRGECGACTVIVDGAPVLSCLVPWARAGDVETIEAVSDEAEPLRRAFADLGAYQCGFCTSGQLMRGVALIRRGRRLDRDEIATEMGGNICRCTGYRGIVAAVERALEESEQEQRP